MSSLRLALKQSLQESGVLNNKQSRANRNRDSGKRKKRRSAPGEASPRKRKSSKGHGRRRQIRDDDDDEQQQHHSHQPPEDHSSSDENEFSAGEEEDDEVEDDDDDEEVEDEEEVDEEEEGSDTQSNSQHNDDQDEDEEPRRHRKNHSNSQRSHQQLHQHQLQHSKDTVGSASDAGDHKHQDSDDDGEVRSDEERRRKRKLQKKLKHSAAHKIQSQWKKKKEEGAPTNDNPSAFGITKGKLQKERSVWTANDAKTNNNNNETDPSHDPYEHEHDREDGESQTEEDQELTDKKKKKTKGNNNERGKGKTAKTVPPPAPEILEWNRALPVKRARRNVAQGLRVKVRFATKIKRDGKIVRKKRWFGGRVSAVSKEGSKIRIKYDDGTAEISKFPDKDVVVDDAFNGEHQANASKFQPPMMDPEPEPEQEPEQKEEVKTTAEQKEEVKTIAEETERPPQAPEHEPPEHQEPMDDDKPPTPPSPPTAPSPPTLVQPEAQQPEDELLTPTVDKKLNAHSPPGNAMDMFEAETPRPPSPPVPSIEEEPFSPPSPPIPIADSELQSSVPMEIPEAPLPSVVKQNDDVVPAPLPAVESPVIMEKVEMLEHVDPPTQPLDEREQPTTTQSTENQNPPNEVEEVALPSVGGSDPVTEVEMRPPSVALQEPPEQISTDESGLRTVVGEEEDVAMPPTAAVREAISEKPAPARLTIRIPNLMKERREPGLEAQRSPRIRIHKRSPLEEPKSFLATDEPTQPEGVEESLTPTEDVIPGKPRPDDDNSKNIKVGARFKRRRSEEDVGPIAAEEVRAPSSKRIYIRSTPVSEVAAVTTSTPTQSLNDTAEAQSVEENSTRAQSVEKNEQNTDVTDVILDDGDNGPVKIIGNKPAMEVPTFPDEEIVKSAAVEFRPETQTVVEPAVRAEPISPVHTPGAGVQTQRPRPTKGPAIQQTLEFQAPSDEPFQQDKGKVSVSSSRNSAFERKDVHTMAQSYPGDLSQDAAQSIAGVGGLLEITATRPSTPPDKLISGSSTPIVRSGRRAAQQANDRIVSTKDEEKDKELGATGKKRKKREKADEDSESSTDDDCNWVQCDACKKWRIQPPHIKISSLPEQWYCHMNVHDPKRSTCDAPEQTAKTPVVKKPRKRGRKKRQRAMEIVEASKLEDEQALGQSEVPQPEAPAKETIRARSPVHKEDVKPKEVPKAKESMNTKVAVKLKEVVKPKEITKVKDAAKPKEASKTKETVKSAKEVGKTKDVAQSAGGSTPKTKLPRASPSSVAPAENITAQDTDSEPQPKRAKTRRLPDTPLESIPELQTTDAKAKRVKGGKSRKESKESLKEKNKDAGQEQVNNGAVSGSTTSQKDQDDNVEWVQCEKCDKWRRLPNHISADELPEVWYCTMNTWNPGVASCDAPEDKVDGQQDITPSPGGSSGGLSYRNLIFGSGRKVNRPVSERARAAESIFATTAEDSECGYPTVKYANSSAFAPRGSRANIIEEDSSQVSVFDIMQHSSLWAELRGASQPYDSDNTNSWESAGFGKPFLPKYSFETIPREWKQDMKDMILQALGNKTLLGEEVLLECQCRQWDNAPLSREIRAYFTKDTVITLLCELVKEGKVQLVQTFGKDWTVKDWNPRYRRSNVANIENAAPVALKSRCMKIAKPWKRHV